MIRNYYLIAMRSLLRNRVHSAITISGLGLGVACCLLIALFVRDEWTYDKFHSNAGRIFRVYVKEDWGENQQFFNTVTPLPMGPALKANFPEVEQQVRLGNIGSQIKAGEEVYSEQVVVAGTEFFEVFDFPSLSGDPAAAMKSQDGVILTERQAQKYFGQSSALNQPLSVQLGEKFEEFVVRAVVKDLPSNSSVRFDVLISDLNYPKLYSERLITSSWFNTMVETYVLLREGTDPASLTAKFPSVFRTILGEEEFTKSKYGPGLQALTDIHSNTAFPVGIAKVSNPRYAYILAAIAGLILFVACINFVTLSVGHSLARAREVGIRKAVGAQRSQLLGQFLGEAILTTFVSSLLGIFLALLTLPRFNVLSGKALAMHFDTFTMLTMLFLLLIIGVLAGSYPALVLSGIKPVAIFRGQLKTGGDKQSLRKLLVGFQLILCVFLISSTLVMRSQLNFIRNKNLGFSKEQLIAVPVQVPRVGGLKDRIMSGFEKIELLKAELSKYPEILQVSGSSHEFGKGAWTQIGYTDEKGTYRNFNLNIVDAGFVPTLAIRMKEGRNFSNSNPSDARRAVLVNEAFLKDLGWTDGAGKRMPGKFIDHEIIGVVSDFNFASLYNRVEPLVMVINPEIALSGSENISIDNSPIPKLMVRVAAGKITEALDHMKATWEKVSAGSTWQFSFVDESLAQQYRSDTNLGSIVSVATALAILIGAMGLYALASLAMQGRTKEISIRKVMGATEESLLFLVSRDYLLMVVVCLLLSAPATILVMNKWLTTFEYRVSIGWSIFAFAGGLALVIVVIAIGYHTLKAVWSHPADTLKYE